jgi:acyl-CoA thioesterase
MGDLAIDAAVSGGDGHYTAKLSPEWNAWGPNGGYLAAILTRAALAHGDFAKVAAVTCHFLSVARFDPVDLVTATLRRGRSAQSVRVSMGQDGTPIAEALVWLTADGLDGLRHDTARMPRVPPPESLRPWTELVPDEVQPETMWENIEGRPIETTGEPYAAGWYRFAAHTTDDLARQLVLLDVMGSEAAWQARPPEGGFITPNLDLSVQFHRTAPGEEWLLAQGFADVAEDGLVGFRSAVWSRSGRLLASGSGQLFCRPE